MYKIVSNLNITELQYISFFNCSPFNTPNDTNLHYDRQVYHSTSLCAYRCIVFMLLWPLVHVLVLTSITTTMACPNIRTFCTSYGYFCNCRAFHSPTVAEVYRMDMYIEYRDGEVYRI